MPKRVLIVDDEENIREMTRLALEASGYEVGEAANGLEAFAIIGADESWDAVLLDQKMPGMVGTEVLRRLRVMLPTARVIMMTAFASVDLAVQAMKLGASDFVRKPMTPGILRNAVAAALAKKPLDEAAGSPTDRDKNNLGLVALNGFTIVRHTNQLGAVPVANEYLFTVREPNGREQNVVVEIAPEALERMTDSPASTTFWREQAEQFLSDFLWNDGHVPATGRLTLKGVEHEAVQRAARKDASK